MNEYALAYIERARAYITRQLLAAVLRLNGWKPAGPGKWEKTLPPLPNTLATSHVTRGGIAYALNTIKAAKQ